MFAMPHQAVSASSIQTLLNLLETSSPNDQFFLDTGWPKKMNITISFKDLAEIVRK
jgi:hypothetical protein